MGAQSQQQPVYYDTDTSQYYTNNNQNKSSNILETMFGNMGMLSKDNPFYATQMANRNYLGNPYGTASANRFIPKNIPAQYPEMNMLLPGLNAGLAQGLMSSTQPDGAMYGAGRFLAPQTTSESKGK